MSKQHYQLPNQMSNNGLKPMDQFVYIVLKSFSDGEKAFPSLKVLANKSKLSINTLRESIGRLEKEKYIEISKVGKKNVYVFSKYKSFEPFSEDFIDSKITSQEIKAFILALQQHMFKDIQGYGKVSYSNKKIAELLNISEDSVFRYNSELKRKNLLTVIKNNNKDPITGCLSDTKIYDLNSFGQAIIWKLREHEEVLYNHEDRIQQLEEFIKKNFKDQKYEPAEYIIT